MPHLSLLIITFFFIFVPFSHAAEWPVFEHGIAMHGTVDEDAKARGYVGYVNPDAPKGGHLKMAASKGTFDTLNPFVLKGTAAEGVALTYGRLMARRWDEPFSMYPLVAERIYVPEDRSAVKIALNEAAKFSDGTPITADDVVFSFEALRELGRPNMRRIYKLVDKVEKHDEHSLTFYFGEGYDQETVMIMMLMPVLSKAWWEGRDFEATLLEPPVTSGPYKIENIDAGRSITYQRDPDYWAKDLAANVGHYNFDRVTYEYFRDDSVALEAFNKGDINFRREADISKWMGGAYKDTLDIIKYEAAHQRPEKARGFIFNTRRTSLSDVSVRKALYLAFDEGWIGQNIFYGKAKRTHGFFANSPLSVLYGEDDSAREVEARPSATAMRGRLKEAAALLDQAGWHIKDGKRLNKSGESLTFEVILNKSEDEKIALNWKSHLDRLGVDLSIRVLDTAAFQKRRQDYDFDIILHHWQNSLSPGAEQMLYWGCQAADTAGQFNYSGICDPEIDALLLKISDAKTYDVLTELVRGLDRRLQDAVIMVPLFHSGQDYLAHRSNLNHPQRPPLYGSVIETWWDGGNP